MSWQSYFRAVQFAAPLLAQRSPQQGLVESTLSGERLLYHWDRASGALEPLGRAGDLHFPALSPDGGWLFYLQDEQGNDCGHVVCRRLGSVETLDVTPGLPPYNTFSIVFSHGGSRVGFTCSGPGGFFACVVDLDLDGQPGRLRELYHTRALVTCPWLSADGSLAVLAVFGAQNSSELLALDVESGDVLATLSDGPGCDLHPMLRAPFSPVDGDQRLLTRSNRSGFYRPLLWDPRSGKRLDLELDDLPGDILPRGWSPDGRQILLEQVYQAVGRLGVYDMVDGRARWLDLPGGVFWDAQFGNPGEIIAAWEDLAHPARVVAVDPQANRIVPLLCGPQLEAESSAWQSITFPSSDGQPVQAWLAVPAGRGPFPTIIEAHGGPGDVQRDGYAPQALAWVELGFAFASVNYRGSLTFGKAFQDQIQGDMGYWELEDLAACRAYLIKQGIADPRQVFLTGYCYGGFLTLLGLGRQPDLWRGGLAGAPIADWRALYEDTIESGRAMALATFGGSPEEYPECYRKASPVAYIEQVRAPLFVWKGSQDFLIASRQVEEYIARLRARGIRVETAWFAGGHDGPLDAVADEVDLHARKMDFIQSVLADCE